MVDLKKNLSPILETLGDKGFDVRPLIFEQPATEQDLIEAKHLLGVCIPSCFRWVLATIGSRVEFRWHAPNDTKLPKPFHQSFSGESHWSLPLLLQFAEDKQGWIETVFPDLNNPYDHVWHNKLAFHKVGHCDYLAIDLDPGTAGSIVCLSHDDGEGHGHVVAPAFDQFLNRWVPLGCPGAEDWQWIPFTNGLHGPLTCLARMPRRGEDCCISIYQRTRLWSVKPGLACA